MEEKKKKPNFLWRAYMRDGKGVGKEEVIKGYSPLNFFRLYFRRFMNMITINLLYIFGNFPILFLILAISGFFSKNAVAPSSLLFPFLNGISTAGGPSPELSVLFGIAGVTENVYVPNTATYILYGIGALIVVTFGLVNVGCTYLIRETVRGEHVFVFEDFFSTIKKNFWQGLGFGIFDLVVLALCLYANNSYLVNYSNYSILFFSSVAMTILYLFVRFYIYLMIVTFDLKPFQILKNSFIFAILAFGRNLLSLLACAALAAVALFASQLFMPIGVIMVVILMFSTMTYITMYICFPKVEKLMIEPYYAEHPEERPEPEKEYDQDEKLDKDDIKKGSSYLEQ